jgi:hypothetical protein
MCIEASPNNGKSPTQIADPVDRFNNTNSRIELKKKKTIGKTEHIQNN